ncbi:hypothetical protein Tco_0812065 [Tanacetum coccineum]
MDQRNYCRNSSELGGEATSSSSSSEEEEAETGGARVSEAAAGGTRVSGGVGVSSDDDVASPPNSEEFRQQFLWNGCFFQWKLRSGKYEDDEKLDSIRVHLHGDASSIEKSKTDAEAVARRVKYQAEFTPIILSRSF